MTAVIGAIIAAILFLIALCLTFLRIQESRKLKLAVQQFAGVRQQMEDHLSEIARLATGSDAENRDDPLSDHKYPNKTINPQNPDPSVTNFKQLFLSHASEDKENLVRPVADELQRRNLSIWLDEGEIAPGVDFVEAIQKGMKQSDAVVVFITEHFLGKRWPLLELNNFIAMGKPIIPIVSDLSVGTVLEQYPLLSSTHMMLAEGDATDAHEIGRVIERSYSHLGARNLQQVSIADSLKTSRGTIMRPVEGSSVDRHILAEGTLASLPEQAHLWLVVEIDQLKWPKEPCVFISGSSWRGEAYEGGTPPDGRFSLSIYGVEDSGHRQIKDWIDEGHRTGSYPGLSNIKDSRRLSSVKLRIRTP